MKLPGHNRILQTCPDAMHTIKDCIERIFFLLIGKVNIDSIVQCESALGRFDLKSKRKQSDRESKKITECKHPYILTTEEIKLANKRSKTIIVPNSDFNPGNFLSELQVLNHMIGKRCSSYLAITNCICSMLVHKYVDEVHIFVIK